MSLRRVHEFERSISTISGINIYIHSLPKVKHGEENANFRKAIRIEEDAIRCRGRWKYANMLGIANRAFLSRNMQKGQFYKIPAL